MSKRYGRNQKRKHREQLKKAQDTIENVNRLASSEIDRLEAEIKNLKFRMDPVDHFNIDYAHGASMVVPSEYVQMTVANLRKVTARSQVDLREMTASRLLYEKEELRKYLASSLQQHMVVTEYKVPASSKLIIESCVVVEIKK